MYKFTPPSGKDLGIIDSPYLLTIEVASDTGGFEGNFEIDGDPKEEFEASDKLLGSVSLEKTSVTITNHIDNTVDFYNETGDVEVASMDNHTASATVDDHTITVTGQTLDQPEIDTSEDNLVKFEVEIDLELWWEDLLNGEHTITVNITAPSTATATYKFRKETSGTVRKHKWKKVGYLINPVMDEIEPQKVILCDRQLRRICELTPVENLRYVLNELNKANEISFNYYKYVDDNNIHGFENDHNPRKYTPCPGFDRLQDLSIVQVGREYFEVAVTKSDDGSLKKSISGVSLGFAELSQLINTIEINTDEDLDLVQEFVPTIFYNQQDPAHSLLNRILSSAPHYKVGHVDNTLWKIQRTFSWQDTDLLSMLNNVGEECNCVFDIEISRDTEGNAIRTLNAYDLCYCKTCWDEVRNNGEIANPSADLYRNIVNGKCLRCEELGREPYNLHDIGYSTNVFISTDHMANNITINSNKDQIKNSFKLVGGDDLMTDTLTGLNMSAANRITIFSPQTKKEMSIELHNKLDEYEASYKEMQPYYDELMEIYYDTLDIIQYLQHTKMPVSDEVITSPKEALYDMIRKFSSTEEGVGFNSICYVDKKYYYNGQENFSSATAVATLRNALTIYKPKGFGLDIKADAGCGGNNNYFYGTITVYNTSNRDDCVNLKIDSTGTNSLTAGKEMAQGDSYEDESMQDTVIHFKPRYLFAETQTGNSKSAQTDKDWKLTDEATFSNYIKQYAQYLISKNVPEYRNEIRRDWSTYGYERLKNYYDGYLECMQMLESLQKSAMTKEARKLCDEPLDEYTKIRNDIKKQMDIVEDQVVALCLLAGQKLDEMYDTKDDYVYRWKSSKWYSQNKSYYTEIIESLLTKGSNTGYTGKTYKESTYIGDKPYKCKKCGSTQVAVENGINVCTRRGCHGSGDDIYTYHDIVSDIVSFITNDLFNTPYNEFCNDINNMDLAGVRNKIQQKYDLLAWLGGERDPKEGGVKKSSVLYDEMMSFVREDVYNNSNYTSEGLSNAELIQQATEMRNKATRELAKACIPQITFSMSLSSLLALEPIEWQGKTMNADFENFCINNYVRVQIDEDIYRLRISSIELAYPVGDTVNVTFTDASRYLGGGTSDLASILSAAQSMATSYNYVADQSEKGVIAENIFEKIYRNGMDTALMNVKAARNQDIVIDEHGILLREMNEFTEQYSPYQMKMINRNIVFTDDEWETAKLAIGLGRLGVDLDQYGQPINESTYEFSGKYKAYDADTLVYGVWADVLCGSLICGENLVISNSGTNVFIGKDGIAVRGGYLDVGIGDNRVVIDPLAKSGFNNPGGTKINPHYLIYAKSTYYKDKKYGQYDMNDKGTVFYVKSDGSAFFAGKLWAREGHIGNWEILEKELYNSNGDAWICTGEHRNINSTAKGFYLSHNGLSISNMFYVKEVNGKTKAYINGTVEANDGYIGGWYIEKYGLYNKEPEAFIYTDKHSKFDSSENGLYLGQEGISLGDASADTNSKGFFVTKTGDLYAYQGMIGPFLFNQKYEGQEYDGMFDVGGNLRFNTNGLVLNKNAAIYIGQNYTYNILEKDSIKIDYNGGTIIRSDGSVSTNYLDVMDTMIRSGLPNENVYGVHFALTQGRFPSISGKRPYQLRLHGANKKGKVESGGYIGVWQEGRLIVGEHDYGNPGSKVNGSYAAYKASIDGSIYIDGKIHCAFGEESIKSGDTTIVEEKTVYWLKPTLIKYKNQSGSNKEMVVLTIAKSDASGSSKVQVSPAK